MYTPGRDRNLWQRVKSYDSPFEASSLQLIGFMRDNLIAGRWAQPRDSAMANGSASGLGICTSAALERPCTTED